MRFPVNSNFDIEKFSELLQGAPDCRILDFIRFGCPIGHDGSEISQFFRNHTGALPPFTQHIADYIHTEIAEGVVIGPFRQPPFDNAVAVSPLNSVPKKDSAKRRVIVDLSFPHGKSVNDGIDAQWFLNQFEPLIFPSIDDLIKIIHKVIKDKGTNRILLFKRDISRAYRWLPVDVGSIHLLGYWFQEKFYFDLVLPMGLRSSAHFCQMLTDAISYIFHKEGLDAVNYIDDFGGADSEDRAWEAFYKLGKIISDIGLHEAVDKASPPSSIMVFLGLEVNVLLMTVHIPDDKWEEILAVLQQWSRKSTATKRKTQRLVGLLNFAARCVRPGRLYFSRILNFLREFSSSAQSIPDSVQRDIRWWSVCAQHFNGTSLILNELRKQPCATV